jgi:hypothetical protein
MYKSRFVSIGFSQQEEEDYDETLAPIIEEVVTVFAKTSRETMILIHYEIQRDQSLYLRLSYLHERRKNTFNISQYQFQMKLFP